MLGITIRMGAANWDAHVMTNGEPVRFNFRTMAEHERKDFFRIVRTEYRKLEMQREVA